jgi:hypothetical protein
VQVAHRGRDVGVAHPRLDLHEARAAVNGEGAEGVPQVMEAQAPQASGVACLAVARAERVAVELALGQCAWKHELVFAGSVRAPLR